jgi:hypothetical protein
MPASKTIVKILNNLINTCDLNILTLPPQFLPERQPLRDAKNTGPLVSSDEELFTLNPEGLKMAKRYARILLHTYSSGFSKARRILCTKPPVLTATGAFLFKFLITKMKFVFNNEINLLIYRLFLRMSILSY